MIYERWYRRRNRPGSVQVCEPPAAALLHEYREAGAYTDCFATEIAPSVSHGEYVEAFYTTWVFKLERLVLAWFVARPSSDRQAKELASWNLDSFAAWTVEGRTADQLLMCDFQSRTRSWLMSTAAPNASAMGTRLYFGSVVVPIDDKRSGRKTMGFAFRALLGFHKIYSRVLLRAAASKLLRAQRNRTSAV